jgi:hypothetical protein
MKRKSRLAIGLCCTIVMASTAFVSFRGQPSYHFCLPVSVTDANLPLIEVQIGNIHPLLVLDLGDKLQLTLNKRLLQSASKRVQGKSLFRDALGNSYESRAFRLPLVQLGKLRLRDVTATEQKDDFVVNTTLYAEAGPDELCEGKSGSIGRALLGARNLLLDFGTGQLYVSNNRSKLKKAGYDLRQFVSLPFEMARTGVVVPVVTDVGSLRLSLDTGSTFTIAKPAQFADREVSATDHGFSVVTTCQFSIGEKDFGSMDIHLFDITPELHEIDGVLGMDFLEQHILYIDYDHGLLWIGDHQRIDDYHVRLPVRFSCGNAPLVPVELNSTSYSLKFDLGGTPRLTLNKEILEPLSKVPRGKEEFIDMIGNCYQECLYVLPKARLGAFQFDDVIAAELNDDFHVNSCLGTETSCDKVPQRSFGSIGSDLLGARNILLDTGSSQIYVSSDVDKLKQEGYDLNRFVKAPFERGPLGIVISVTSDVGLLRFVFQTTTTVALVKPTFFEGKETHTKWGLPVVATSKFVIGGKDFGKMELCLFDISREVGEIDGILGMSFFQHHVIYIDQEHHLVWIGERKTHETGYHTCLPIALSSAQTPLINVEIEGRTYPCRLNLGHKDELALDKKVLETLATTLHEMNESIDVLGNRYEYPSYRLGEVRLGKLQFCDVVVSEVQDDYISNTTLWTDDSEESNEEFGYVGRGLLKRYNLLLDLSGLLAYLSNDRDQLKSAGYDLNEFVQVPFESGKMGIVLAIESDAGLLRFMLDTGSTISLLRDGSGKSMEIRSIDHGLSVVNSSKFLINGHDFGNTDLHLFPITPKFDIDGVLGADFLQQHVCYIDHDNQLLWIGERAA